MATSELKNLVSKHWHDIDGADILSLKDSLCSFLVNRGTLCEQQVLKMVTLLLAKIVKLAYHEQPIIQGTVADLI